MSVATTERAETGRMRFRLGLRDLALWVVGAAVFFALARGARGFWMDPKAIGTMKPMLDVDRVVAVGLLAPVTLIALKLFLDALRAGRGEGRAFAAAWRLAAVAFLAGMTALLSRTIREDADTLQTPILGRAHWQVKLAVNGLAFGAIAILLGVVAPRRIRPGRRPRWLLASVALAGLAGVGLLAFWGDSIIFYLILIALEAVKNAKQAPGLAVAVYRFGEPAPPEFLDGRLWPSFDERMATAGLRAGLTLLACVLTAHWLSRDLRAPAEDRERPRSWAGLIYRAATALAAWGMGAYLLFFAVSDLHPPLVEGLWSIVTPRWTLAVAAMFAAMAAGLSARGVAGPGPAIDDVPRSRWPAWAPGLALALGKVALALGLVLAILAAIGQLTGGEAGLPWWSPFPVASLTSTLAHPFEWTTTGAIYLDPYRTPDALVLLASAAVLVALTIRFFVPTAGEPPIDRIGRDGRLVGRFLGAWVAMTGVMLALLPAFFLGGMALLHFTLKAYYP
jgi:hypothetical protein